MKRLDAGEPLREVLQAEPCNLRSIATSR
jgi:hypothetical protein